MKGDIKTPSKRQKSRSDLTPKPNNMNQKTQNQKWHKEIKKANRKVEQDPIKTRTQTWSLEATTEVNGKPVKASIREAWISED